MVQINLLFIDMTSHPVDNEYPAEVQPLLQETSCYGDRVEETKAHGLR